MSRIQDAPEPRAILVVDDDPCTLETTGLLLRSHGWSASLAQTGAEGLAIARSTRLHLALLDHRLPDMTGFDVAKSFARDGHPVPWVLTSGFMDYDLAAHAGRCGAVTAVSAPFDVIETVTRALQSIQSPATDALPLAWPQSPLRPCLPAAAGSTADRWARLVLLACDADADLPTSTAWASFVGIGHGTLRALCGCVNVSAHDARDFTRVLRALVLSAGSLADIQSHLLVGDPRTLQRLLTQAGVSYRSAGLVSADDFLTRQQWVPQHGPAMSALRRMLRQAAIGT